MMSQSKRLPENVRVDFGKLCPGTSNPMPPAARRAYEDRIRASTEAQAEGSRLAAQLFVGAESAR